MRYIALAAVCFFTTNLSFAQSKKFTFKLGSEYELPRKSEDLSFIGNEKDGIVNLSIKKDELNILKFDYKTLNQTGEKVVTIEEKSKYFVSEKLLDFGANYYWLHSDYDKSSETEFLNYDVLDIKNAKMTNTNKKIIEATKIASNMVEGGYNYFTGMNNYKAGNKYQYNFDADNSKLLVSYRLVPEVKNDKKNFDKLGVFVFDDKMNKIWGGEFTMPYNEAIMDNSDFSVDSKGNAYLLSKVYDSEKRKEKDKETGKAAYHYEVLKFTKDSKKIINSKIEIGDFFIKEASLVENSLHEMVITCTYSKKAKGTGTDGVFLALMDQSGKITKYKNGYYEFPLEELVKFESKRAKRKMEKKDDYEAPNLSVRNIVVEADGSLFLDLEEYFIEEQTNYSANRTSTTYIYHYENIVASKIKADGNFAWVRKIPKMQRGTQGRGTMGYKLVFDATGYYFLYLDNKKNMELEEDEAPKYHVDGFGGQVVVAKIDNAGVVTKELVFDTREEEVKIFPAQFKKINGNQFIGRASVKRGDFKPLMITVN
jgi:hypothetical protein